MIVKGYSNSIKRYRKKPVIIEAMKYTEDNYEEAITFVGKENCIVKVYDPLLILIKNLLQYISISKLLKEIC